MTRLVLEPPSEFDAHFTIMGEPATKSRPRFSRRGGKVVTYSPDATMKAQAAMGAAFIEAVGIPNPTAAESFGVEAAFYVGNGQRRDVDNMLKLIMDGLNKIAWADDHQVYEVIGRKIRVPKDEARTEVRIYSIGPMPQHHAPCELCGHVFERPPSQSGRKYCGPECRAESRRQKKAAICTYCGSKFSLHNAEVSTPFCSVDCMSDSKRITETCVTCGDQYTVPRSLAKGLTACSQVCRDEYYAVQKTKIRKGTCQDCGGPVSRKEYARCKGCSLLVRGAWSQNKRISKPGEVA